MYGQGFAGYGNSGGGNEITGQQWGTMSKGMQEQWMADAARQHANGIFQNPNSSPLEKSIAAVQYNGTGWWSPWSQYVPTGSSFGGGPVGGYQYGGEDFGGMNQNRMNEMMAQNQRWAMSNPYGQSGAGGNWGSGRMYGVA